MSARNLIFFGYSGANEASGTRERDRSFFLTAQTLKLHVQRRFPDDIVDLVCAWHKDVFVNTLRAPGPDPRRPIRQIHYVGHGAGGGLFFGYRNKVAVADRQRLAGILGALPNTWLMNDRVKRRLALLWDAGLISGFFSDALDPAKRADIKARLAPDALMHVWGCFAGAPTHTFEADRYWNLFNAGGASVEGIAKHIARTLGIETTACWDPGNSHGMDFCIRTSMGAITCPDKRENRLPHWMWPTSSEVRWITHDAMGTGSETTINFLGDRIPATQIPPGWPPKWLTDEIPIAAAKIKQLPLPTCSAARLGM